jgi:hypothetical protein
MPYPEVVVALGDENENQTGIAGNPLYVQGTVTATSTNPVVTPATGIGAILLSYSPGAAFWLEGVTLHLSAAGTTSENFRVWLDANDGTPYDTILLSQDLSTGSVTDLLWQPDSPLPCEPGDAIVVTWPNSEGRIYGVRIVTRTI